MQLESAPESMYAIPSHTRTSLMRSCDPPSVLEPPLVRTYCGIDGSLDGSLLSTHADHDGPLKVQGKRT
jgi:hypothetical protein